MMSKTFAKVTAEHDIDDKTKPLVMSGPTASNVSSYDWVAQMTLPIELMS